MQSLRDKEAERRETESGIALIKGFHGKAKRQKEISRKAREGRSYARREKVPESRNTLILGFRGND